VNLSAPPRLRGKFFPVLAGSAATALAFALYARVELPYVVLGWIGLVPWLAAVDRMRRPWAALGVGLLMADLFVVAVFPWLPRAIGDYSGASRVAAVAVTLLIAPLLQPQFITCALGRHIARRIGCGRIRVALVGASAYVGTEWLVPKLFADTIGQGLYASAALRQAADIAGAPGLTFLLILANEGTLGALQAGFASAGLPTPWSRVRAALLPLAGVGALLLGLTAYGGARLTQFGNTRRAGASVTAAIVQANVSHYDRMATELGTFEAVRRILDPHFTLSAELMQRDRLDLLIWPETVYPTSFGTPKSADGAAFDRGIGALVNDSGVPLLFGTYERDRDDEFNVAVLLEPGAAGQVTFDSYRKGKLFPFTEYVPAWLDSRWLRRHLPWTGRWKPGSGARVLTATLPEARRLRIAPLICYDAIDPDYVLPAVRDGAEVLVTLSNDSWFAYPGVQRLILILSSFRSIETRRPQVRATPTGISAVIDATGELEDVLDAGQRGTIVAWVAPALPIDRTLVIAWGNWCGPAALVCGLLVFATASLRIASRK
jgi:apolipoprotein N-acyltransferase